MYFIVKCLVSGLIVGLVSEVAKRSPALAAILASLPLTSILAFVWLYHEKKDASSLIELSNGIALIVLPSIVFFICFSILMKKELNFYLALIVSSGILALCYAVYDFLLKKYGLIK
jgi:hypothetical protein